MQKLPVIFRAERAGEFKGDVTAVFPTLCADYRGYDFVIYAHIGQHGGGRRGWYNETRAARPDEYSDLLAELRGIYERGDDPVELVVYQRMTPGHRAEFMADYRRNVQSLRDDPRGAPWSAAA